MKTTEELIIIAVLDGEVGDAARLISSLLPKERAALAIAAKRVAELCQGDSRG